MIANIRRCHDIINIINIINLILFINGHLGGVPGCTASQPSCFSRLLTLTHSPACQLQLLHFIYISHSKYRDPTTNTLLYLYKPAKILQADCKYSASVSISPRKYFTETDVVKINLIPSSVMGGLFLRR